MVRNIFFRSTLRALEKCLLRNNNFELNGENYELILFIPSDNFGTDIKYTLAVAAKKYDTITQKDITKYLLTSLKDNLSNEDYNCISRITVLSSYDPLVKNLKLLTAYQRTDDVLEISDFWIGGITISSGFVVQSKLLKQLKPKKRLVFELRDSPLPLTVQVIRIDDQFNLICLRENHIGDNNNQLNQYLLNGQIALEGNLLANDVLVSINIDNIVYTFSSELE